MIYNAFITPKRKAAPSGTHFLNTYQEEINKKTGCKELVKTGETNVYEMIQADLESTKIENILHSVAMGDLTALQQREMTYADTTSMPKNLMEAQNLVLKMKAEFDQMPIEVKKEFNNSAEQYISEMGTPEFQEKMAPYNKKIAEIAEAGNLKEYQKKVKEQAKFEKDVAAEKGGEQ